MKKAFIGLAVLVTLVGYSLFVRHEQPKISAPSSLTADTSNNNKSSTISTPPSEEGTSSGSGGDDNASSGNSSSSSSSSSQGSNQSSTSTGAYKDGSYTGSTEDAYYGNVQVKATISGGKLTSVTFLDYPHTHSTSVYINQQAMPYLQQEAIKAQSANVNIISGATYTSQAFTQSLSNALSQAS